MQTTLSRLFVALAALLLLACNGSSRHLDDDRKSKKDDGESSEADTFLADMVKKTNCNAKEIPYIFQRARSLSLKIGMSEIQNEFKDCQKSKALGDTSSSDESSKDSPSSYQSSLQSAVVLSLSQYHSSSSAYSSSKLSASAR